MTAKSQRNNDTTLSKKSLDSLLDAHNNLKRAYMMQENSHRLKLETVRLDTIIYGQDSTVIRFWANGERLQKKIIQRKNKNGCVIYETSQFYNKAGLLEYAESRNSSCGIPESTDPDIKVISGMDTEYERFEYDSLGRVVLRVWWYYSIGARRYSYSYDSFNQKTIKRTHINKNQFW